MCEKVGDLCERVCCEVARSAAPGGEGGCSVWRKWWSYLLMWVSSKREDK